MFRPEADILITHKAIISKLVPSRISDHKYTNHDKISLNFNIANGSSSTKIYWVSEKWWMVRSVENADDKHVGAHSSGTWVFPISWIIRWQVLPSLSNCMGKSCKGKWCLQRNNFHVTFIVICICPEQCIALDDNWECLISTTNCFKQSFDCGKSSKGTVCTEMLFVSPPYVLLNTNHWSHFVPAMPQTCNGKTTQMAVNSCEPKFHFNQNPWMTSNASNSLSWDEISHHQLVPSKHFLFSLPPQWAMGAVESPHKHSVWTLSVSQLQLGCPDKMQWRDVMHGWSKDSKGTHPEGSLINWQTDYLELK